MKRETLEKIRNILEHLLELFIFILIMLITFGSLHVHAASVEPQGNLFFNAYLRSTGQGYDYTQYIRVYTSDSANLKVAIVTRYNDSSTYPTNDFVMYTVDSPAPSSIYVGNGSIFHNQNDREEKSFTDASNTAYWTAITLSDGTVVRCSTGGAGNTAYTYEPTFPIYEGTADYPHIGGASVKTLTAFFEHLLVIGDIKPTNGGSIDNPDFEDTAYAFTGFTANNKMTATWTGTTERTYLQDQEVEEYVRVNYYFADKEAQDTIKQADAYSDEFATADKTLTIDVSGLKPDNENWFLRYIRITPCYRQAGLGAWGDFYHGSDVYVYFDVKGNIEKVIQKSKPTDLNKGNMVYDSSIGYLQNVIYTEQKTHDGSGRQATFKWSTLKSLPDDAQIEIVAQNFYIEWFNKKTEENFIYKEYGEDCFYSAGSYSFNANTPVWTWLKEKEIDPFSIKTQSYGSTEYYLRIVVYNDSDSLYHYGGWVKVDIKSKDTTIMPSTDVETGGFDDSSGLWNQDTASSDSYHYSTDDKGKLTGNIDVNSWEDLNMNSFTWMYRNMQSMVSSLGEFPAMVNAVFGYLPVQYITSIGVLLVAIVLLRFLGR